MTSDELARIVGAMTERPWRHGRVEKHHVFAPCSDCLGPERVLLRMNEHFEHEHDARAIVALANHADALVELVRACEALRSETHDDFCLVKINRALRRVHAVGKEDKDA